MSSKWMRVKKWWQCKCVCVCCGEWQGVKNNRASHAHSQTEWDKEEESLQLSSPKSKATSVWKFFWHNAPSKSCYSPGRYTCIKKNVSAKHSKIGQKKKLHFKVVRRKQGGGSRPPRWLTLTEGRGGGFEGESAHAGSTLVSLNTPRVSQFGSPAGGHV